jgi:hypothetical protein
MLPARIVPDLVSVSEITAEVVAEWRAPRYGRENPERMNNPLWDWLIRTRITAFEATQRFGYPSSFGAGPAWCCARFGQSATALPDGRVVLIGGEHEDYYDPDFRIYNDVIVLHPDGAIDVFGYPQDEFPPTDFHSATLLADRILIVGSLGYFDARKAGETQVAELDLKTFAIRQVATKGDSPGWLHKHEAVLREDGISLRVRGGLVAVLDADQQSSLVENPDTWVLDIPNGVWARETRTYRETFVFRVENLRALPLWQMEHLGLALRYDLGVSQQIEDEEPPPSVPPERMREFEERFGSANQRAREVATQLYADGYDPDLQIFAALFKPDVPHEPMPEPKDDIASTDGACADNEEDFDSYARPSKPLLQFPGVRISVRGITVRYKTEVSHLEMIVEGRLHDAEVQALVADLKRKLETLLLRPVTVSHL